MAAVVLLAAAAWQLTPLKTACLRHCRSPISFFLRFGATVSRPLGALRMGATHGAFCLGCCWALMAVLVAFGTMNLAWMAGLAALILVEKGAPIGERAARLAAVATRVVEGRCGDVDLSGIDAIALLDWPGPIHDGNGKAVFVVPPAVTDEQLGLMAQIFTGQLGGLPWSILGTTFEITGVVRTEVQIDDDGINSGFSAAGVGEAKGGSMKNPVTGEDHHAAIVLETGFIWTRGDCGQGTFHVEAEGISLDFTDSNWIYYDFDWTNEV